MSLIRFLLDENVDPDYAASLRQTWPEVVVWLIGQPGAPPRGTLDPDILRWCEQHQFSLVTNNRTSMPVHLRDHIAAGQHVPGIFIINSRMTIGQTVDALALIWLEDQPENYTDLIIFLHPEVS
jgi:hypothetical protein